MCISKVQLDNEESSMYICQQIMKDSTSFTVFDSNTESIEFIKIVILHFEYGSFTFETSIKYFKRFTFCLEIDKFIVYPISETESNLLRSNCGNIL